ncbi:hypothetical protein HMPREF1502_2881 [Klebsiella sp. AS10]|nr:hypothetical protein HMPREF1502_2881 [Klebsiella sp. AS10]
MPPLYNAFYPLPNGAEQVYPNLINASPVTVYFTRAIRIHYETLFYF